MQNFISFIGVACFLGFICCFIIAYKKNKKKVEFKKYLIAGSVCFVATFILVQISKKPDLEKIEINNIKIYKDETKDASFTISPEDADKNNIECFSNDESILSIKDNEMKGIKKGSTTYVCTYKDSEKEIKSNEARVEVKLTDKQIAENEKKAAEKAEKEKKEAEEKAAEEEANKNVLSSSEQAFAKDYAKQCVEKVLKAPSTAKFPGGVLEPYKDWGMSKLNNLVTVASYVDSENSFGAMIRSTFRIQMQINGDTWSVTYFEFDGEVLQGTYQ